MTMNGRLLLVCSDSAVIRAVTTALDSAASLLQIDHLPEGVTDIREKFQPNSIIIDTDARSGVSTAHERIVEAKRRFPGVPLIALGNEMSAQLVLAALRGGADDFLDREAGTDQIRAAIRTSMARNGSENTARAKIAAVLSPLPGEQDQDFALNLALRAAKRAAGGMALYIDLSLPATQAGVALGLGLEFGVPDAVREMARLDRALLEGALAREPRSGLYLMPLAADFRTEGAVLEAAGFAALLQMLQNIFDVMVIGYGPFSRQRALLEMVRPAARFFVCCNQRFSAIRGAGDMLRWLSENRITEEAELVVHEMARGQTPAPADICKALNISRSINMDGSWSELAGHFNDAKPMALSASRYGAGLDACLSRLGLAEAPKQDVKTRLRGWLHPHAQAAAT
jgi:pilus assembly protein CpaE